MSPPLIRIAQRHRAKTRAAEPKSPSNHNGVNLFPSCLVIPFVLKTAKGSKQQRPSYFQGRKWWVGKVGNCPTRFWKNRILLQFFCCFVNNINRGRNIGVFYIGLLTNSKSQIPHPVTAVHQNQSKCPTRDHCKILVDLSGLINNIMP